MHPSYVLVFQLVRGLRDSQTNINNEDIRLLAENEAEDICKNNIWSSFLCVLAISSVGKFIYFIILAAFQKHQKTFNQKIYPRERSGSNNCFVLLKKSINRSKVFQQHKFQSFCQDLSFQCRILFVFFL